MVQYFTVSYCADLLNADLITVMLDDRGAWAYYQFPTDMFNGETVEEWVALSGKQGEGQEGNINIILSFTVEKTLVCVYVYV